MSSRSTSRASRLYSFWQDTNAASTCCRAVACASTTCCAERFRAAEEAHLALSHQIIERAQGFLDRGLRVRAMQLVKVDPIGAQPLQARLGRVHDEAP